jgi:hypothetical protein
MWTFLLDLLQRGREFLPPRLEFTQGNNLGLIGIQHALVLPFEPLPSLQPLGVLRLTPGEVLLCGFRPRLMQVRNHLWIPQYRTQSVPDHRIEPLRTDERGGTSRRPADRQRSMPGALVVEIVGLFAGTQWSPAPHAEPACAAFDECPQ